MTTPTPFISFAQNGEDVILNRALVNVDSGRYVDVGANHPTVDSVTRSFYNRGWSGIAFEPNPAFAAKFRVERPRDIVIEAAVTDAAGPTATFHLINGTGLSTLVDSISADHAGHGYDVTDLTVPTVRLDDAMEQSGFGIADVHFVVIDTEGAEDQVLRSIDFTKCRPWILVIEATSPGTTTASHRQWEDLVLAAGYEFCMFDGLSRYYVSNEMSEKLKPALSYPVCVFDDYVTIEEQGLRNELARAKHRAIEAERLLLAFMGSFSWRITRPLRFVRQRLRSK